MPIWGRIETTRIVMRNWAEKRIAGVEFTLIAVVSSKMDQELLSDDRWNYVWHPNRPLGAKFNAGVAAAGVTGCDVVLFGDSDDLIDDGYIARGLSAMKRDAGVFGILPGGIHFYDSSERVLYRCRDMSPGCGVMVSSDVLEFNNWQIYEPGKNKYLNRDVRDAMMRHGGRSIEISAGTTVDIKTVGNMWGIEYAGRRSKLVSGNDEIHLPMERVADHEEWLRRHWPREANLIMALT